jgi:hypothetical protein
MHSKVPRTALPGRSQSAHDLLAKGLGYFSIALGMTELLAPRAVCEAAGIEDREGVIQVYGAREIAQGIAILASHDPTPWIWGRVAGDALDIGTVLTETRSLGNPNTILSLVALAGVTALDMICATGLTAEKGGRDTATADYRNRSGFPKGIEQARGVAREFSVSRHGPQALRSRNAAQIAGATTGASGGTGAAQKEKIGT